MAVLREARGMRWVEQHDVWGAVDLAAMHPQKGFLFVQVTTRAEDARSRQTGGKAVAERRRKLELLPWPLDGGPFRVEIWEACRPNARLERPLGFRVHHLNVRDRRWEVVAFLAVGKRWSGTKFPQQPLAPTQPRPASRAGAPPRIRADAPTSIAPGASASSEVPT